MGLFLNVDTTFPKHMDDPSKLSGKLSFGQRSKKSNSLWLKIWLKVPKMDKNGLFCNG